MTRIIAALVLMGTLFPTNALSHHSNVAYEVTKVITITGVVMSAISATRSVDPVVLLG